MTNKFTNNSSKIVGVIITAFVIALLVLVGPAEAFSLGLDKPRASYQEGETVKTVAVINVNPDEVYNGQIELRLDKPNGLQVCTFNINGTAISGCNGITIKLNKSTTSPGYGYLFPSGYGYGVTDGKLVYSFEITTTGFVTGNYFMQLRAGGLRSKVQKFTIVAKPNPNPGNQVTICHIPPGNPANQHTITVPQSALAGHLKHGDTLGACPVPGV